LTGLGKTVIGHCRHRVKPYRVVTGIRAKVRKRMARLTIVGGRVDR
jgi:hypothetical protein